MANDLIITCPKCKNSKSVRVFCNIHTAFKQDENGVLKVVDNSIDAENIINGSVAAECMECDQKINLDVATVDQIYNLIR